MGSHLIALDGYYGIWHGDASARVERGSDGQMCLRFLSLRKNWVRFVKSFLSTRSENPLRACPRDWLRFANWTFAPCGTAIRETRHHFYT